MNFDRNIIVVAGQFATGKTRTIREIHSYLSNRDIPYTPLVLSDAAFIINALSEDHRVHGGIHHVHDGQMSLATHEHLWNEDGGAFTVTGQFIPDYMFDKFFIALSEHTPQNSVVLAEWSGGGNTNHQDHPASKPDYSFNLAVERLERGHYRTDWISHTLAIVHPVVRDEKDRIQLNERRRGIVPVLNEIQKGGESFYVPEPAMRITGKNDFPDVTSRLERLGLQGRIHQIVNNGGDEYAIELHKTLDGIFQPFFEDNEIHPSTTRDRSRR